MSTVSNLHRSMSSNMSITGMPGDKLSLKPVQLSKTSSFGYFDSAMSWPNYPATLPEDEEDLFQHQQYISTTGQPSQYQNTPFPFQYHTSAATAPQQLQTNPAHYSAIPQYRQQPFYPQQVDMSTQWTQSTVPLAYQYPQQGSHTLSPYLHAQQLSQGQPIAGPSVAQHYLSPDQIPSGMGYAEVEEPDAISGDEVSQSDSSQNVSSDHSEMSKWGTRNQDGSWSCAHPSCKSQTAFKRGCDLRKHYKRHDKTIYCRHADCSAATAPGFSSKKDRDRHEAKHNPSIPCSEGCPKFFSREDNMRDHVRRIHKVVRGGSGRRSGQ